MHAGTHTRARTPAGVTAHVRAYGWPPVTPNSTTGTTGPTSPGPSRPHHSLRLSLPPSLPGGPLSRKTLPLSCLRVFTPLFPQPQTLSFPQPRAHPPLLRLSPRGSPPEGPVTLWGSRPLSAPRASRVCAGAAPPDELLARKTWAARPSAPAHLPHGASARPRLRTPDTHLADEESLASGAVRAASRALTAPRGERRARRPGTEAAPSTASPGHGRGISGFASPCCSGSQRQVFNSCCGTGPDERPEHAPAARRAGARAPQVAAAPSGKAAGRAVAATRHTRQSLERTNQRTNEDGA